MFRSGRLQIDCRRLLFAVYLLSIVAVYFKIIKLFFANL